MRLTLTILLSIFYLNLAKAQVRFDFKFNDNEIDKINTFDGTFKRAYIDSSTTVQFKLTEVEIRTIAEYAHKYGLDKIKPPIKRDDCGAVSFPAMTFELEFFNKKGELIQLNWGNNNCNNKTVNKLHNFTVKVHQLIIRKEELKNLKDTDILIL